MTETLARIIADKRVHVAESKRRRSLSDVEASAQAADRPRGFRSALETQREEGRFGLIAEIKKASPSKGVIRADFDPPALARAYAAGGAVCLSVLTDVPWFQGDDSYLVEARSAVSLPVLRKDFMVDPYQVVEARALGADCILLIMAAIDDGLAAELESLALALGMDVLVEVHDATELERATRLTTHLLGINNRDLKTLQVDLQTSIELAKMLPQGYLVVGESGLRSRADLERLSAVGITSFLIGESLMARDDVAAATRELVGER